MQVFPSNEKVSDQPCLLLKLLTTDYCLVAGFLDSLSLSLSTVSPVPELECKPVSLHGLAAFGDIQTRDSPLEFIEFLLKPGTRYCWYSGSGTPRQSHLYPRRLCVHCQVLGAQSTVCVPGVWQRTDRHGGRVDEVRHGHTVHALLYEVLGVPARVVVENGLLVLHDHEALGQRRGGGQRLPD